MDALGTRKNVSSAPALHEDSVPPKRLRLVKVSCDAYNVILDPKLRATGPSGHLQMSDILTPLYENACVMVSEGVTHDGTTTLWPYTKCTGLVSLGMKVNQDVVVMKHQAETLKKINHGGNARSCNVKMPCAAGKTLLSLLHICELQTFAIVFTNCSMASQHWFDQVHRFFKPPDNGVVILNSDSHGFPTVSLKTLVEKRPAIVICTYQMMTSTQQHNESLTEVIEYIKSIPWGAKILDEAQTAVANSFKKVLEIQSYTTMTVSASYQREDDAIKHLFEKVSGLVITVDKEDLIAQRLLPRVSRIEVHIEPFGVQAQESDYYKRQRRDILDPRKVSVCLALMNHHATLGDNIIIFCDDLLAVELLFTTFAQFQFETDLNLCGRITMDTPLEERLKTLASFRESRGGSVLLMSKVGDVAIDLPGANVLIQTSCMSRSKNQELQRFGRIQRNPAVGNCGEKQHTAYNLAVKGSEEAKNVMYRRIFMAKEGYVTTVVDTSKTTDTRYDDKSHVQFAHNVCWGATPGGGGKVANRAQR